MFLLDVSLKVPLKGTLLRFLYRYLPNLPQEIFMFIDKEEEILALKNMCEGIVEYFTKETPIYNTPYGAFQSLTSIQAITGDYKTTISRRLRSKQNRFSNWYIIEKDTPLYPAEECSYCDELDDILFKENCWFSHTQGHIHCEPLKDNSIIFYLYQGVTYQVTYQEFKTGCRPHNQGDYTND